MPDIPPTQAANAVTLESQPDQQLNSYRIAQDV